MAGATCPRHRRVLFGVVRVRRDPHDVVIEEFGRFVRRVRGPLAFHGTMTAMAGSRRSLPFTCANERTTLEDWLDFQRATLAAKCEGLSDAQLRLAVVPPSSLTLVGLIQHMAQVERHWFRRVLAGEDIGPIYGTAAGPEGASDGFAFVDAVSGEQALANWAAEMAQARTNAVAHALDEERRYRSWDTNLRSIYVHMIGEYARHNGHADLIRERIDGRTGL